jgi:hypothetical protein
MIEPCAGSVSGEGEMAFSKTTPRAASASRYGVATVFDP